MAETVKLATKAEGGPSARPPLGALRRRMDYVRQRLLELKDERERLIAERDHLKAEIEKIQLN